MTDCIFCRIVAGEIPGERVLEDERFIAIRDINPKADVHVLVIPREHRRDLDDFVAASGDGGAMLAFVTATARELGVEGRYRLITSVGSDAGQEVFHLHWHILSGGRLPGF